MSFMDSKLYIVSNNLNQIYNSIQLMPLKLSFGKRCFLFIMRFLKILLPLPWYLWTYQKLFQISPYLVFMSKQRPHTNRMIQFINKYFEDGV